MNAWALNTDALSGSPSISNRCLRVPSTSAFKLTPILKPIQSNIKCLEQLLHPTYRPTIPKRGWRSGFHPGDQGSRLVWNQMSGLLLHLAKWFNASSYCNVNWSTCSYDFLAGRFFTLHTDTKGTLWDRYPKTWSGSFQKVNHHWFIYRFLIHVFTRPSDWGQTPCKGSSFWRPVSAF